MGIHSRTEFLASTPSCDLSLAEDDAAAPVKTIERRAQSQSLQLWSPEELAAAATDCNALPGGGCPGEPVPPEPAAPTTPRALTSRSFTPPPRQAAPLPPLLKALILNSEEQVSAALRADPAAATEPFWDHEVEPPLCCAARLGCGAGVVRLLLDAGADPEAADVRGRVAGELARPPWVTEMPAPTGRPAFAASAGGLAEAQSPLGYVPLAAAFPPSSSPPLGVPPLDQRDTETRCGDGHWRQELARFLGGHNTFVK